MSACTYRVVKPNSLILPMASALHREPPRPVARRQDNYDQRYDFDTVFCDVFRSVEADGEEVLVLNGPIMLNLAEALAATTFSDAETGAVGTAELHNLRATQHSRVRGLPGCRWLRIDSGQGFVRDIQVSENNRDVYAGRKALVGISKDNDLTWIRDWAQFYAVAHGVDAVVLYDNSSTTYGSTDVLNALGPVPGIEVATVVEWPFPFGAQGGNWEGLTKVRWDSNYCQSTALEHARWRFLNDAAAVVQCDIDELLVSERGTIFDELADSDGLVYFRGHWIESIRGEGIEHLPRFEDFCWRDRTRKPTTRKWVIDPARTPQVSQWKVHGIVGADAALSTTTHQRHFRGISNSWKFDRNDARDFDPKYHVRDTLLERTLARVFGTQPRDTFADRRPLTSTTLQGRVRDRAKRIEPTPSRVWFTDNATLVVAFNVSGQRFGFDVVLEEDHVRVVAAGYTRGSVAALRNTIQHSAARAVDSRHWEIGRIRTDTTTPEAAADEVLDLIMVQLRRSLGLWASPQATGGGARLQALKG